MTFKNLSSNEAFTDRKNSMKEVALNSQKSYNCVNGQVHTYNTVLQIDD